MSLDNSSSTILLVASISLALISSFSLVLIFYLHLNSHRHPLLFAFTSLSPLRLTLVCLILIWTLNETIIRLSLILPTDDTYKLYVVLSLGVLEPAFLTAILYLVYLSIHKTNKTLRAIWIIPLVVIPTMGLQITFLYFENYLPEIFRYDVVNNCTYPLFCTVVFAGFVVPYCLAFLVTYKRVVSLVINKGTRLRLHALAITIITCVPLQVLLLASSLLWKHEDSACGFIGDGMFLAVAISATTAEVVLVIKPIIDALSAAGQRPAVEEGSR